MTEYQFSTDWFSDHIPTLKPIIDDLKKDLDSEKRAMRVLEIGSWEGRSAIWFFKNACDTTKPGSVTCIDHFDLLQTEAGHARFERFQNNLKLLQTTRIRLMRSFSFVALSKLMEEHLANGDRSFEFVYIDGSHRSDDTLLDAEMSWRITADGGVLVFDDYEWSDETTDSIYHPRRGIDAFLDCHQAEFVVLSRGYQIVIKKKVPLRLGFHEEAMSFESDTIYVAMCFSRSYVIPACVALHSLSQTTSRHVSIFVYGYELTEKDIKHVLGVANPKMSIRFISGYVSPLGPQWGRIDMIETIPSHRVLYLDADTLIKSDIAKLWATNMAGNPLAAARDVGHPWGHTGLVDHCEEWNMDKDMYFNAGVLIIDVDQLRLDLPSLRDKAQDFGTSLKFQEQDLLNIVYKDRWTLLDLRWNMTGMGTYFNHRLRDGPILKQAIHQAQWSTGDQKRLLSEPGIVHFTGPVHPRYQIRLFIDSVAEVMDPYMQPFTAKPWGYVGAPGNPFSDEWVGLRQTLFPRFSSTAKGLIQTKIDEILEDFNFKLGLMTVRNLAADVVCPVCQSTMEGTVITNLPCGHSIHQKCISTSSLSSRSWCAVCNPEI